MEDVANASEKRDTIPSEGKMLYYVDLKDDSNYTKGEIKRSSSLRSALSNDSRSARRRSSSSSSLADSVIEMLKDVVIMDDAPDNSRTEKRKSSPPNGKSTKLFMNQMLIAGCFFAAGTLFGSSIDGIKKLINSKPLPNYNEDDDDLSMMEEPEIDESSMIPFDVDGYEGINNSSFYPLLFEDKEEKKYASLLDGMIEISIFGDELLPFADYQDTTVEDMMQIMVDDLEKEKNDEMNDITESLLMALENEELLMEEDVDNIEPTAEELKFIYDGDLVEDENDDNADGNRELEAIQWPKHRPLTCNNNLESQSCANNKLTNLLETVNIATDTLVIPCGVCYEVDMIDGSTLTLPKGLRVEGKLYFPSSSNVVIRATSVFVLGILKIDPPTDNKQVKFLMFGEEDQTFRPAENGAPVCSRGCNLGSKVIAVVGGQLDIRGYDATCPAWEKLQALGPATSRPMSMPCDGEGNCMPEYITLDGECHHSGGHSNAFGKYTVWCPIERTPEIRHGEEKDLKFKSMEPLPPPPFEMPTGENNEILSLMWSGKCHQSPGHSNHFKKCTIHCPLEATATINTGEMKPLRFTSSRPEFSMPEDEDGNTLELIRRNKCVPHTGLIDALGIFSVLCKIVETFDVRGGPKVGVKFTNAETGEFITASKGINNYAYAGKYLIFHPDTTDMDELNRIFPPDTRMIVDYDDATAPISGTVVMDGVHHWAHGGSRIFMFPRGYGYSNDECQEAVDHINNQIPEGYNIDIDWEEELAVEPGHEIVSKGIHHWSWVGTMMFFFPENTSVDEFNAKFPPGYRIQVSYTDAVDYHQIKVSPEAGQCWGKPGTELVLSSSTRNSEDRILATVTGYDASTGMISVEEALQQPIITLEDHADFAVEVAALNRPVIFEAESDNNDESIGGHLIIHQTDKQQHIEGVEIRNFGQQGRLAKYPLHFHLCNDLDGSMVKRNVVRQSNQRCFVAHSTNSVIWEENVAFDTVGHCYFLEVGDEKFNTFRRNLAIEVENMPAEKVLQLSSTSQRIETDDKSSAFWISNAENEFYGNVAAGTKHHGWWFETRHQDGAESNLIAFENNEVHSSGSMAFTVYPPGWRPSETNVIKNLKVYRNRQLGVFLHGGRNLHFENGVFADNTFQDVWINRADSNIFEGTIFIGNTGLVEPKCYPTIGRTAVELGATRLYDTDESGTYRGSTLIKTKFYNWTQSHTGCQQYTDIIRFDDHQVFTTAYDAAHRFEDLESDEPLKLDSSLIDNLMDDVIVEVSSDAENAITPSGQPGFFASEKVTTFLAPGTCSAYNGNLFFCPNVCLRTITFVTGDAPMPEDVVLVAKDSESGREIRIERDIRMDNHDHGFDYYFHAHFTVALPAVRTEIHFEKKSHSGTVVWPSFAYPVLESAPSCTNYITESDLSFIYPTNSERCDSLVYNGNFDSNLHAWHDFWSGIEWSATEGIDGSSALITARRSNPNHFAGQWLDTTCLQEGDKYQVEISYRLVDDSGNTMQGACQGSVNDCPKANIEYKTENVPSRWLNVATTVLPYNTDGTFNTIEGIWIVSQEQANADRIRLAILGGSVNSVTGQYILDNVSVTKILDGNNRKRFLRNH